MTEPLELPDAVFPNPLAECVEDAEAAPEEEQLSPEEILRQQLTAEITREVRAECSKKLREEQETQRAAYEQYMEKARAKAEKIKEQAETEAAALVAKANGEANGIREAARAAGYEEGVNRKIEQIEAVLADLGQTLETLKDDQLAFEEDFAKELRELSLEISEKLVCTMIDRDDSLLLGLVRRAVKPIREAGWIKIDVSDKLGDYAAVLEKMIANARPTQKIEVETRRDAHKGTCVIQTADGVVVASVLTQLANIRTYFTEFEKECETTDENESGEALAGTPAAEHQTQ